MNITDGCTVKKLDQCTPNQIVRELKYGSKGTLSLVALDFNDKNIRSLISFENNKPNYKIIKTPTNLDVLAYDAKPILKIDQTGPFEGYANNIYDENGVVIRTADAWMMRVLEHENEFGRQRGLFDIEKGELINYREDLTSTGFFGKWKIYLPNEFESTDDWTTICDFLA
ncbi:hypothetical protein [uncultured Nisaea sp.]|uniref:hypothetical protein n=1 Tax=uncultured Nisaea sp. TaxID=538215 RepID=UPI0030EDBF2A|tara:strand:- start:1316 stop:1825 length:510 start_codon:yes stop_codon:yes gene_type:complete